VSVGVTQIRRVCGPDLRAAMVGNRVRFVSVGARAVPAKHWRTSRQWHPRSEDAPNPGSSASWRARLGSVVCALVQSRPDVRRDEGADRCRSV